MTYSGLPVVAENKPERSRPDLAIPEKRWVAARALYEGTPGMTMAKLAEKTGLGKSSLERKANEQGWKKNFVMGQMTEEAQKAADMFAQKVDEFGPEITAEEKQKIATEVVHQVAVDVRAEVLDRHRREWAIPRKLSQEAVLLRDLKPGEAFDRAKMAKITAETLKILQDGERKAWGLDVGELPPGDVLVIERVGAKA